MGLFGLLIAMVVNIFLKSSGLDFVISAAGVLIFAGMTAWDTQRIKEMYDVNDDGTVASAQQSVLLSDHSKKSFSRQFSGLRVKQFTPMVECLLHRTPPNPLIQWLKIIIK